MLKKTVLVIGVVLIVLVGLIALEPEECTVSRSITINAPPSAVFDEVSDFHRWEQWSPWAKLDPAMESTYEGAAKGVGSSYAWSGSSKVGQGKMTIVDAEAPRRLDIQLEFQKPMRATNRTQFTFQPEGNSATQVTWTMTGKNGFIGKAFHLVVSTDKMVGPDFEKGLSQLKTIVEKQKRH